MLWPDRASARPGRSICNLLEFYKMLNISFPKSGYVHALSIRYTVQAGLELVVANLVLRQFFS